MATATTWSWLAAGSAGQKRPRHFASEDPDRSVCLIEAGPDYGPYAEGAGRAAS